MCSCTGKSAPSKAGSESAIGMKEGPCVMTCVGRISNSAGIERGEPQSLSASEMPQELADEDSLSQDAEGIGTSLPPHPE